MAEVDFYAVLDLDEGRQVGVAGQVGELRKAHRETITTTRDDAIAIAKRRVQAFFDGKFPPTEQ